MSRKLRYSERKKLAESGNLGPLDSSPSEPLLIALDDLVTEGEGSFAGIAFKRDMQRSITRHFGWGSHFTGHTALAAASGDELLDLMEILVEAGSRSHDRGSAYGKHRFAQPIPGIEGKLNDLFDRHRFGFRIENGEMRKIGSPALDDVVVGPALLAVRRTGWEEAERSFREAIRHQRGGEDENDDALTAANAALEAALKAAGLSGDRLSTLAKSFRNSDLAPSELAGVPEALDTLLKRSGAIRDNHGDSHGKSPGAETVSQGLVDLAIHWAGAFIVFLAEVVPSPDVQP